MKAKEVLLLIVIVVAGVVFYHAQTGKWDFRFGWDENFGFGNEYAYTETLEVEPPFGSSLRIVNSHGKVEVQGTDRPNISIIFEKRIRRRNEETAKEVADRLRAVITKDEQEVFITTNRAEFKKRNFQTHFKLSVPLHLDVRVETSYDGASVSDVKNVWLINPHGSIFVSGIEGEAELNNSYDEIEARNVGSACRVDGSHSDISLVSVEGDCDVRNSYGTVKIENAGRNLTVVAPHSEIIARHVRGSVDVQNSYQEVTLEDVGPAKVQGHHSAIDLDGVQGDVEVRNSYEPVRLRNIEGSLIVDGSHVGVSGRDIGAQSISIHSTYEDIELVDFTGKTEITLSHGSCILRPMAFTFPLDVRNEYSEIRLFWPRGERTPVEARSRGGRVRWQLPDSPAVREGNGTDLVKAYLEETGKPAVNLATSHADIRIEERSEAEKDSR